MKLVDKDTRRWVCKRDKLTFIASQGGWIEGSEAFGSKQPKSQLAAMVINLFPGGGVLYAGQAVGAVYPVLAVICVFVSPPALLLVMLVSFFHTYLAIQNRNRTCGLASPLCNGAKTPIKNSLESVQLESARDPIHFDFADKAHLNVRTCGICDHQLSGKGNYCPGCGAEVPKRFSSDWSKTRTFG